MVLPPAAIPCGGSAPSTRSGARRPLHQDDNEEQQAAGAGRRRGMTMSCGVAPTGASAGTRAALPWPRRRARAPSRPLSERRRCHTPGLRRPLRRARTRFTCTTD